MEAVSVCVSLRQFVNRVSVVAVLSIQAAAEATSLADVATSAAAAFTAENATLRARNVELEWRDEHRSRAEAATQTALAAVQQALKHSELQLAQMQPGSEEYEASRNTSRKVRFPP